MSLLLFYLGSEALVVGPRNTAVIVGQKMEMKCQVDSNLVHRLWSIQRTLERQSEPLATIWNGKYNIFDGHFGVDNSDFGFDGVLYTNSTTLDDAGIYICSVQRGSNQIEHHSAHLIVFGKLSS